MVLHSLRAKLIIPMVIMLVVLVSTLTIYSIINFSSSTQRLLDERINASASALQNYLDECVQRTRVASISASANEDVIHAIQNQNRAELTDALTPLLALYGVDYYAITDAKGIVLLRTHDPERYGDSIAHQQNIIDALQGKVSSHYESGVMIKSGTRAGSPVYNADGELIGVVIAGIRFDTNEIVDDLKEHFGGDVTVYSGDVRLATTVIIDGERIVGTKLEPKIAQIVIDEKQEYFGPVDILGENYISFYMPLINPQDEAFSVISIGLPSGPLLRENTAIITRGVLIAIAGLAVSVAVLLVIVARISRPVKQLSHLVSEVSCGNIDIQIGTDYIPQDEIGGLIHDTYSLIDIIKSIVGDLTQLTRGLTVYSDIDYHIDSEKYSGSYKEIIENVEVLTRSISTMHKTMAVADYLDTMISVVDLDYNLLYANRAMVDMYDVDRDNYIGKKCYKIIRGLDEPCSICQLPALLPYKDSYPSADYEYLWDDVSDMWLGGRAAIMRWVDGGMVFFNSINDETMRMRHQEQLQEAITAAQAASQAKSQFLANMSHEIRTPMNAVLGMLDLLLAEKLDTRQLDRVEDMKQSALWLLEIINDILDVSKIQAEMLSLVLGHYDFSALIDNVNSMAQSLAKSKKLKFELVVEKQVPRYLYGDEVRVKQILMNLIGNAVKFTEEGEIKLAVTTTDEHIYFSVIDTGIGISEEDLPTLFEAFVQADITQNRIERGTGLGLTITRSIVEIMGGHISVESTLGKGSTFTVEIPKVLGDINLVQHVDVVTTALYAPNAKILVVDDIQTNLSVICGLLELHQIFADSATSGKQAIEMVQQKEYDMVLMDYRMPEMDGIEATTRIRQLGVTTPIIALTASAAVGAREKMINGGMDDYLSKPIMTNDLTLMLRKWIPVEKQEEMPLEQ